jgi:hypothetical protein
MVHLVVPDLQLDRTLGLAVRQVLSPTVEALVLHMVKTLFHVVEAVVVVAKRFPPQEMVALQ